LIEEVIDTWSLKTEVQDQRVLVDLFIRPYKTLENKIDSGGDVGRY